MFLAGVLGRLIAFSLFVWVGFVPVRFIAPFWLVCCDGVRLHLGRAPSRVGFAFTLLFYCVPYFLAQFCVVVLILFPGSFFSLVIAVLCLGGFSRYAHIVFSSFLFPPRLFARPFGHVNVLGGFLSPPPISLVRCRGCTVTSVGMPLYYA